MDEYLEIDLDADAGYCLNGFEWDIFVKYECPAFDKKVPRNLDKGYSPPKIVILLEDCSEQMRKDLWEIITEKSD